MAEPPTQILGDLESLVKDPKATDDFSQKTAEGIPQAEQLAKAGRVDEAAALLLGIEKKARQAADAFSVSRLCIALLVIYKNTKDWNLVGETIVVLTKKRGQLKKVIVDIVQIGMEWVADDQLMGADVGAQAAQERKIKLIETLSGVTEGKIFVENQRARLTKMLAVMKENEGSIEAAAQLLQEVQVETYGAMDKVERCEYIITQMRVVLAKGDYVRCQIISRKINPKLLAADDMQHICLKYNELMVRYNHHGKDFLSVSKNFYAIFQTKIVQSDPLYWKPILSCYIIYLLLSPFDNEQADLLNKVATTEHKKLAEMPMIQKLVSEFLRLELLPWPLPKYAADLQQHPVFVGEPPKLPTREQIAVLMSSDTSDDVNMPATSEGASETKEGEEKKKSSTASEKPTTETTEGYKGLGPGEASSAVMEPLYTPEAIKKQTEFQVKAYSGGDNRWDLLRKRVIQHNLKVVEAYYRCVTLNRLSVLLGVDNDRTETEIAELVTSGYLKAKIDRPAGIVLFGEKQTARDRLDEWGGDINNILDVIEESCHLIAKERMVHAARAKAEEMALKDS